MLTYICMQSPYPVLTNTISNNNNNNTIKINIYIASLNQYMWSVGINCFHL